MRLIVDSNQTDPIRFTHQKLEKRAYPTLVIPHLVWVELLEGPDAEKRRRALQKFPLLFGMEMGTILDELANRSEYKIRCFVPVYSERSPVHKRITNTFVHPTRDQARAAAEVRDDGRAYRQRILENLPLLHKYHRSRDMAAKARGEALEYTNWHTIRDGEHDLFLKEGAPYRQWLIEEVGTDANGKPRRIASKTGNAMFDAAWDNPIFRRFLQLQALVNLGYAQKVWEDPGLNRLPRMKHDDLPDISLVLYARNGDTILTADNIKERIRHVDEEKSVNLSTWDDWLRSL